MLSRVEHGKSFITEGPGHFGPFPLWNPGCFSPIPFQSVVSARFQKWVAVFL